ncbi:SRPBCC family protein [Kitasatospora sp. NPDC057542]|uniref:SRPBCC family protein n=1 Tax=Kitasatospora sp. NPDC057542 TaxID=3346162 RepID=UPI0036AB9B88
MQLENTLTISAPADEVFAYLARPENLPRWNYALDRTEQTSRDRSGSERRTARPARSRARPRSTSASPNTTPRTC